MFGARYFGRRQFGASYFGDGGISADGCYFGGRYFGARAFGPRYFGTTAAETTPGDGCYFGNRYFGARHYAARYFGGTPIDGETPPSETTSEGGGGWLPQTRRKSRKQIYEERVKLGILPPPVIKAAAKVAAVAQTVEEFREERPRYEEMFLKAIKKTQWLPDYTRAIQAQIELMEDEEESLLLLL